MFKISKEKHGSQESLREGKDQKRESSMNALTLTLVICSLIAMPEATVVTTLFQGSISILAIALDSEANILYVSDSNNALYRVTASGSNTLLAGSGNSTSGTADGVGTLARFNIPQGLTCDDTNDIVFVSDTFNFPCSRGEPRHQQRHYVSGQFVSDYSNARVRNIHLVTGIVTTVADNGSVGATDGPGPLATFGQPGGSLWHCGGTLYGVLLADSLNCALRFVAIESNTCSGSDATSVSKSPSTWPSGSDSNSSSANSRSSDDTLSLSASPSWSFSGMGELPPSKSLTLSPRLLVVPGDSVTVLSRSFAPQVEGTVRYSQVASILAGGASSGSALGRVMAIRSMVLCDANSAVGGGVIDLSLSICRQLLTSDDDSALSVSRSAIVSNVVLIVVVTVTVFVLTISWSMVAHVSWKDSAPSLRVPSSLLPVLTAVAPRLEFMCWWRRCARAAGDSDLSVTLSGLRGGVENQSRFSPMGLQQSSRR